MTLIMKVMWVIQEHTCSSYFWEMKHSFWRCLVYDFSVNWMFLNCPDNSLFLSEGQMHNICSQSLLDCQRKFSKFPHGGPCYETTDIIMVCSVKGRVETVSTTTHLALLPKLSSHSSLAQNDPFIPPLSLHWNHFTSTAWLHILVCWGTSCLDMHKREPETTVQVPRTKNLRLHLQAKLCSLSHPLSRTLAGSDLTTGIISSHNFHQWQ